MHARAVAVLERGNDEITFLNFIYLRPHVLNDANELVADWSTNLAVEYPAVIPKVGAADTRQHHAHDRIGWLGDYRVWPIGELNGTGSGKDSSAHGYASSIIPSSRSHADTSSCAFFTFSPRTARPSRMVDCGQSLVISETIRPRRLPSCAQNGMRVFPEKSCSDKKVATGMGIVPHQLGEPMKTTLYDSMFSTFVSSSGL